jgi:3-dehydroquinate dehydratase II
MYLQRRILLLNGPNLNMLGMRDAKQYGTKDLSFIVQMLDAEMQAIAGHHLLHFQSNHEGALIDRIHDEVKTKRAGRAEAIHGIIINPGGLSHSSVCLHDALELARDNGIPAVEVHLSDPETREEFRRVLITGKACIATVKGKKEQSYIEGLHTLLKHINATGTFIGAPGK